MKILLDTHIFLWAITEDPRMSAAHQDHFIDEANDLYLSIASYWEIVIKVGLGKLPIPLPATDYIYRQMEKNRVNPLAIHLVHLTELEGLPMHHRDPFDRMLIAQARAEKMPVLTADPLFRGYDVQLL